MNRHTNLHLDIIHTIFEHFRIPDDAETLGICSRVCKTWLPIARSRLFSYIHLQLVPNVDDSDIVPHTIKRNEKWIEWNGCYKPRHADLSLVKEFTISSVDTHTVLTPLILSSILASLPAYSASAYTMLAFLHHNLRPTLLSSYPASTSSSCGAFPSLRMTFATL